MPVFCQPRLTPIILVLAAFQARAQPVPASHAPGIVFKSVLVAGDSSLPVFDNALAAVLADLQASRSKTSPGIQLLSATKIGVAQHHARSATLDHVLGAVAGLKPGSGQGCFVFVTSHGVKHAGLYLSMHDEVLTPKALDRALVKGCSTAPTVVVVSSCFSGAFAQPPMTRANRVILTAARADRTSFGCQAGRTYTVYDKCLLDALVRDGTWTQVYATVKTCVGAEEKREDVEPSEPQAWFGAAVKNMALPVRAGAP